MKANSVRILRYVQEANAQGKEITANDIAEALDLSPRSVNGSLTALSHRIKDENDNITPLIERIPAEIETEDGIKAIKLIKITEIGKTYNPVEE